MKRFKIFNGNVDYSADILLNAWLAEHPNVIIIDFKYQSLSDKINSICILYEIK